MSAQAVNSGRVSIESWTNLTDTTVPFFFLFCAPFDPTHSPYPLLPLFSVSFHC